MNMPGLPNPWVILAVVAAFIANGAYWDWHGHHSESLAWKAAQAVAAEKQHALVKAKDDANQALKDKADADYLKSRQDVDTAYARGLHAGRLRDKGGQCVGVPQPPAAAGNPPDTTAGCGLSAELSAFLWDRARRADLAAIYAQAGHSYAVGNHP